MLTSLIIAVAAAATPEPGTGTLVVEAPPGLDTHVATCARCHGRVARQWSGSAHAAAFSNERFQAAWAPRPQGWCVQCHAPLEDQHNVLNDGIVVRPGALLEVPSDPTAGAPGDGVSCAVCHLREGKVRTPGPPSLWARLAHPAEEDPALTDNTRCAGCHQFNFPRHTPPWPFALSDSPLQNTVVEWEHSAAARDGTTCVDCHFPRGRHSLPGGLQPGFLAKHTAVELTGDCGTVAVTLTVTGAAHAVPTGDPFRALEVRLCGDEDCEEVVGRARFGRTFETTDDAWILAEDTRVPPATEGPASHRTLTVPVDGPVRAWTLWMQLADPRHGRPDHAYPLPPDQLGRTVARGRVSRSEVPCSLR